MKPYHTPNMGSFKAGEDLSEKQFCFVKAGTVAGEVLALDAATDTPIGILMNAPESGEAADVALPGGGAKLKLASSAGTLAAGGFVKTDAAGNGLAVANILDVVCAQVDAVGSAPANSDIVPVLVLHARPQGFVSATVGAMTAKSPESDTEAGFLTISVGGTQYEIPFYAKA